MSIRITGIIALVLCAGVLLAEPTAQTQPSVCALPTSRGGQDLLGRPMPAMSFERWLNTPDSRPPRLEGSVVLYRWWTDTCPYCAKTLPAIEHLRKAYGPRGLKVVAVYHAKPAGDVSDRRIIESARHIGYDGAIAVDSHWAELKKVWLLTGQRHATSVSFLVDSGGNIRFVHPGVEYFPSDDPKNAQQNSDYDLLEKAIRDLL